MIYRANIDLIPLVRSAVAGLQPFARANFVGLTFQSERETLILPHHPAAILPDLTALLCNLILFTPQEFGIRVRVPRPQPIEEGCVLLRFTNDGACLKDLEPALLDKVKLPATVTPAGETGTVIQLKIPYDDVNRKEAGNPDDDHFPDRRAPFFQRLETNLKNYFSRLEALEDCAFQKNPREGNFLKKVNAVILANLDREQFDMVSLARAMAMSRSQLYRRLSPLIAQSPARYIRSIRLEKASQLLRDSSLSVGQIALETGFVNQSHFSRIFRRRYGCQPSAYRKEVST